jgi:anthranilate synthase component II
MNICITDNYDSFTFNLSELVRSLTSKGVMVIKNDKEACLELMDFTHIILSPGPGIPSTSGHLMALIEKYHSTHKILGVCLGHQALAEHFGARLINLQKLYHGHREPIYQTSKNKLFRGLPTSFNVGRYHSWMVEIDSLPPELLTTAVDENGYLMAFEHREFDLFAVQFHPESYMTEFGEAIMKNFLRP